MNSDSNKLLPAYRRFYKTPVKGKRAMRGYERVRNRVRKSSETYVRKSLNSFTSPSSHRRCTPKP